MRKILLLGCFTLVLFSCTEKKPVEEPKIHIINKGSSQQEANQPVSIPMHGTKENSSSATNKRFTETKSSENQEK